MTEPKEYVEGWTEFLGCKIDLSKRPLIPRPETEFWTEKAVVEIKHQIQLIPDRVINVLDLFAGSGCIGIAVARHLPAGKAGCPTVQVTLADIKNYVSTPLPANAKFVQSDLFAKLPGKFDFILANPPYVPEGKGAGGIMESEPKEAIYAGAEGLDVIRPFLSQASEHLNPQGQLWMEFSPEQKGTIVRLLKSLDYTNHSFRHDQYKRFRYAIISV